MNEPRRIQGSLLERAAGLNAFAPPPRAPIPIKAEPVVPPPAAPPVPSPVIPAPAPQAATAPAPAPAPIAPPPAAIRSAPRARVAIDRAMLAEQGLLVPGSPVDVLAEEFRLAKRQVLLTADKVAASDDSRARMVLISSARPNEGKTFSAINLAISLAAEKDVQVLLVDADLAKPDVPRRLGIDTAPGLLDALADPDLDAETLILDTDIPNLSVLQAGMLRANDTELLASQRARQVLDALVQADPRRIVIFDSPPALAASPASVLALHVGQTLLVVRADRTTEGDLRETVALLDGCEHLQLILNSVTFQRSGPRFGSYYGQESQK
ncbi:AAA family ATPase [Sphingomonas sp. BGYR3]|uniref:AAA family ATPase n=1 Tax=Sphingomonas sp. BGYR3 TaxID=2975483 RepID=UPI0021A5E7A8|nr:AAA family ATPase [Sphingomonas sp. BGYR3]MDG5487581.1 AAA family ATPase [Sphingomonas sp. BGYR3]